MITAAITVDELVPPKLSETPKLLHQALQHAIQQQQHHPPNGPKSLRIQCVACYLWMHYFILCCNYYHVNDLKCNYAMSGILVKRTLHLKHRPVPHLIKRSLFHILFATEVKPIHVLLLLNP